MWKCKNCGEQVESNFEVCWNCQTARGEERPDEGKQGELAAGPSIPAGGRLSTKALHSQLEKRYRDAYRVARVTVFFGKVAKILAVVVVVVGIAAGEEIGALGIGGGLLAGLFLYITGVLVAAQGQLLLTSVDNVINTSPLLSDLERVKILHLTHGKKG